MKNMKRFAILAMVFAMIFTLIACGTTGGNTDPQATNNNFTNVDNDTTIPAKSVVNEAFNNDFGTTEFAVPEDWTLTKYYHGDVTRSGEIIAEVTSPDSITDTWETLFKAIKAASDDGVVYALEWTEEYKPIKGEITYETAEEAIIDLNGSSVVKVSYTVNGKNISINYKWQDKKVTLTYDGFLMN
jgi:hypothetical protein